MVALRFEATPDVEKRKVAEDSPAGTTTEIGTDASLLEDFRFTANPAVGAIPSRVTAPTDMSPPTTDFGDSEREVSAASFTVSVAVRDVAPPCAVILAVSLLATPTVDT